MLKLVTELVAKPAIVMICDHKHCGASFNATDLPQVNDAIQAAFIQDAIKQGWFFSLFEQYCPAHNPVRAQSMIQIPKGRLSFAKN